MGLNANKYGGGGVEQPPMEVGTYPARLMYVVDCGVQTLPKYQGQEKEPKQVILFTYEMADEYRKDEEGNDIPDQPRFLSEDMVAYNPFMAERAKISKRYKAFDPAGKAEGDFEKLLGTPVLVTVAHSPKKEGNGVWENVDNVASMREKDAAKLNDPVNRPIAFDFDDPDLADFLALPEWIQKKVKGALDFQGSPLSRLLDEAGGDPPKEEGAIEADLDDEVPF